MLSLPLFFLLSSPELPHSTTMSPYLLFVSQMLLPAQFQLLFLAFLLFFPTHQVPILASQSPAHFLSKRFLTACLLQLPPSYLLVLHSFSFSPRELFCVPPYGAALPQTHSLLPYNRTFPSVSSFCTSHNLFG